jgi:Zn-dependent protease with chaperone function
MGPIALHGLSPQEYEHPDDSAALNALQHTAGLDMLLRKINSWGMDRLLRIQLTGSFLRVTSDSIPQLYGLFETARQRLDLPICPDFYIDINEEINAFTSGSERPVLVVSKGAVDQLGEDELLFVIAHEIGHIKSGHVLYYQIASYLPQLGEILGDLTLGIGNFMSLGLQVALLHWKRTSELTADRAGLLACQSLDCATRSMMKLSGLPHRYFGKMEPEQFVKQARAFESFDQNLLDRVAKYLSISGADHPWTVMRAKELLAWNESGGYQKVLSRTRMAIPAAKAIRRFCDQCGHQLNPGDLFCQTCGNPMPLRT